MTLAPLLALALVAAPPPDLRGAVRALLDEDVEGARAVIEAAAAVRADDPQARQALGLLRLYQHRYAEAAAALEGTGEGPGGFLAIARAGAALEKEQATAESDHFTLVYPRGKDEVLVPSLLEALEAQRSALAQDLGWAPEGRIRVEVLGQVRDLSRLSSLTDPEIRASGTIALCKYDKLMLVSPKALLTGYDWLDTAAHELTHWFITRMTHNRAPIWLQEGLAKWLETRWRGKGGDSFSPYSAALLRKAIDADRLVTFEQMHPSMAKLPTQETAALAFAEVVLAVEYLVEQGGGAGVIGRVLGLVAEGKGADGAVAAALGIPFDRFLEGWRHHMVVRPLPRGGEHALRQLRFRDDPKAAGPWAEWAELPDQKSRDHARLGEIMRQRQRWTAARVEYGKAIERAGGARVAVLASQFATAAAMSGQPTVAEKALQEGIAWNPDAPGLRVQYARILLDRKDFAAARDHLVAATRQDPFDPEIHVGLARALEAQGDPGGASRERRFAQLLLEPGHGASPP